MAGVGRTARGARAAQRALAVLAVLLGLLAMHGLTSNHHAAAASSTPHTGAAAALPGEAPALTEADGAGAHHHLSAASAAGSDTTALPGSPGASCDQTCPELAVLCVAVLTGVAAAVLLARRHAGSLLPAQARRTRRASAAPVRHPRGPDPVRELCVSRT